MGGRLQSPRVRPGGGWSDTDAKLPWACALVSSEPLVISPRASSARVASSINCSTRTSASAPRLVRTDVERLGRTSPSFFPSATTDPPPQHAPLPPLELRYSPLPL